MGQAKAKKARILVEQPICYLCGVAEATTIDHVPARILFRSKVGPEGYEFGSCKGCNCGYSRFEQIAALYIALNDLSEINVDDDRLSKLISGVRNNDPDAIPNRVASTGETMSVAPQFAQPLNLQVISGDLRAFVLPTKMLASAQFVARKVTFGLFRKHMGRPVPSGWMGRYKFESSSNRNAVENWKAVTRLLNQSEITERGNYDIGHQFVYKWAKVLDSSGFAVAAYLGNSTMIYGTVCKPDQLEDSADFEPREDVLNIVASYLSPQHS